MKKKKEVLTKAEKIHFILYRELDIGGDGFSYEHATKIIEELKRRKLI